MRKFLRYILRFIYKVFKTLIGGLEDIFQILLYFKDLCVSLLLVVLGGQPYKCTMPFKKRCQQGKFIVLANGPSLKEDLALLDASSKGGEVRIFAMMNFSANEDIFLKYKPRYYCFADPMFYYPDDRYERVKKVFENLNNLVDWDMTIILKDNISEFINFSGINNPNIKFERVIGIECSLKNNVKFRLYRNGLASPSMATVANLAVFVGIQEGFKQIELCGVDMSFFEGLCVNENNETCTLERHYYDNSSYMKPYILHSTGKAIPLAMYIDMVGNMVKSHNDIAEYGQWIGVSFLNRTYNSMLDCYPRYNHSKNS